MNRALKKFFFSSVLAVAAVEIHTVAQASSSDWLAVDLNTRANVSFEQDPGSRSMRDRAGTFFNDDTNLSVTVTQSIRSMMDPTGQTISGAMVDSLISEEPVIAKDWLAGMPAAKIVTAQMNPEFFECGLNADESVVYCDDPSRKTVKTGTSDVAPEFMPYGRAMVAQIIPESPKSFVSETVVSKIPQKDAEKITLKPRSQGLISVDGGKIEFSAEGLSKTIVLSKEISVKEWSIFVREPSVAHWDASANTLTSKKIGKTELFVVTPGRISIIGLTVGSDSVAAREKSDAQNASGVSLSPDLASLDGLDQAASRGQIAAAFGDAGVVTDQSPADLTIEDGAARLGSDGLNSIGKIVRAKGKVSFEGLRLKFVDERSQIKGSTYPVSGVRIKIAGLDFSELTDSRGEVEVRDVPSGSRLLVEISDDRGYLMPQVVEIVADRDGVSRTITQTIRARRFSSLDFIARSGGVVQDMRRASLCGTVHQSGQTTSDVSVALDVLAHGPFYFNHLGLVDLGKTSTSGNGQFCFFNVEPGPVSVSLKKSGAKKPFSGVLGLVAGRHTEEAIDVNDVRFVSALPTAIGSANEQLGADLDRANRRDLLDQVEMFAVGAGNMMVSVERGMLTTPSRVLPLKGRVWTVSAASDFETVVQSLSTKSPTARQIATFVPNGFVSDMAVLANTTHNLDLGSVLVEHGHLSGHGDESVKLRLVDSFGRDAGDGWYFSDKPVTKAVFFNVPPGVYALIVETSDGHWISSDTAIVYSEALTFVKTGSPLERVTNNVARSFAD